jgi:hypothetical protein
MKQASAMRHAGKRTGRRRYACRCRRRGRQPYLLLGVWRTTAFLSRRLRSSASFMTLALAPSWRQPTGMHNHHKNAQGIQTADNTNITHRSCIGIQSGGLGAGHGRRTKNDVHTIEPKRFAKCFPDRKFRFCDSKISGQIRVLRGWFTLK